MGEKWPSLPPLGALACEQAVARATCSQPLARRLLFGELRSKVKTLARSFTEAMLVTARLGLLVLLAAVVPVYASIVVINSNASDPAPRAAWDRAIKDFQAENPDVEVRLNVFDHESYKRAVRNWLTSSPPDIVFWFAGFRMRQFVDLGLLQDVSALFANGPGRELNQAAIELVSVNGRQYGVPYSHYHIGLFFRRDLFEKAGIDPPPADWQALIGACQRLTLPASSRLPSARGICGRPPPGSTTSTCEQTASSSTWS